MGCYWKRTGRMDSTLQGRPFRLQVSVIQGSFIRSLTSALADVILWRET